MLVEEIKYAHLRASEGEPSIEEEVEEDEEDEDDEDEEDGEEEEEEFES